MPCFSLNWLGQLLVWCVIIGAVIAIVKILLPYVLSQFGEPGNVIIRVLTIVMWAFVAVFVIWLCVDLIQCLLGAGGGIRLPRHG